MANRYLNRRSLPVVNYGHCLLDALHDERVSRMKQYFTASIWREGNWYLAQCLEIDVASQGETEDEALSSLREALELYFASPSPTERPHIRSFEVERRGL